MAVNDLSVQDFKGAKWLLLSGYCLYGENLLQHAVELALQAGVKVALDLASFEVVQSFKPQLQKILESGKVHCCFCNEVLTLLLLPQGTSSATECQQAICTVKIAIMLHKRSSVHSNHQGNFGCGPVTTAPAVQQHFAMQHYNRHVL